PATPPLAIPLATRLRLARAVVASPEFANRQVGNLFRALLHRNASPADLQRGRAFLQGGRTALGLDAMLLASARYYQHRGGNPPREDGSPEGRSVLRSGGWLVRRAGRRACETRRPPDGEFHTPYGQSKNRSTLVTPLPIRSTNYYPCCPGEELLVSSVSLP